MYEYKNQEYYSQVNDFKDDYHKPEKDVVGIDRELLTKIRSLKRRYRDFGEWCDAMSAYQEYADYLITKYGGKKRLKTLYQLGMVSDYIPFYPELRKIKKNRKYYKYGMDREQDGKLNYTVPDYFETNPMPESATASFKIMEREDYKGISKVMPDEDCIRQKLADNLAVIGDFYKGKVKSTSSLSHKAQRKRILENRYRKGKQLPAWERYKKYKKDKWYEDYPEERVDPDAYIFYKDTTLSVKDAQEIEVYQALKDLGFHLNKFKLSKDARKVVKRSNPKMFGKKGKKGKKKGVKLKNKYVREFTDHRYDSFTQFEHDVMALTARALEEED